MSRFVAIFLSSCFLFSSCVTMSAYDCKNTNWSEEGEKNGVRGLGQDSINSYVTDCQKHSVSVNKAEFEKGRQKGLKKYCTRDGGYQAGLYDWPVTVEESCPNEIVEKFMIGYREGQRDKTAQEQAETIQQMKQEISDLKEGNNSCKLDSDCKTTDKCHQGKCEMTGKKCTFMKSCPYLIGTCEKGVCNYNHEYAP